MYKKDLRKRNLEACVSSCIIDTDAENRLHFLKEFFSVYIVQKNLPYLLSVVHTFRLLQQ